MKIIINGAGGRMGHALEAAVEQSEDFEIAARSSMEFQDDPKNGIYSSILKVKEDADVIIDFSSHSATKELCAFSVEKKIPVVIASTGHSEEELQIIKDTSKLVPVFKSGNMSLGVALVANLAKQAAKFFLDADIEIIEKHHNQKLDVPSGTALMIADAIKQVKTDAEYNIGRHSDGKRQKCEIGIHSIRLGNEVGTHEVIIASGNQTITIKHESENRALFADGALDAAEFLVSQPTGLYDMNDIINN